MNKKNVVGKKHKAQIWGIAQEDRDGNLTLVHGAYGRQAIRNAKREVYPGSAYKVVKIDATFQAYTK